MKLWVFVGAVLYSTLAAPAFAACQNAANLVANCGFPSNITGWTVISGTGSHDGAEGSSEGVGSLRVVTTDAPITFQQCIDVTSIGAVSVGYGIDYRDNVANDIETLSVTVVDYTDTSCTPLNETGNSNSVSDGITSTSYEQVQGSYTISATAQGVLFRVNASQPNPTDDLDAHFDGAFFGVGQTPVELQSFEVE